MKNYFYTLLLSLILITLFIMTFIYSEDIYNSVIFSISIWKDTLLPSLFPFFLLSDLMIEYGLINIISIIFGNVISKIFHLPKETSFVIFISLFGGFPSGTKYTKELYDRKIITLEEANHLITFTHFSNPIFVTTTIGMLLLNNKHHSYIILLFHIISNILIGIIGRTKTNYQEKKRVNKIYLNNFTSKSFIKILTNSILKSFSILVNMLGIIIFFLMITTLLKKILPQNNIFFTIISGLLEMTQGINHISTITNISLPLKYSLIGLFISFSGISVHFQVKSIIEGTSISYKKFLIARIIHALLCFTFTYTFFTFIY